MQSTVAILNIPVAAITMRQAVATVEEFIADNTPHLIATANAEMVMMAQEDKELASILQNANLVVPDGAGVVWASRYLGHPVPERVTGYDLSQHILEQASRKGWRIYFFGAAPGVAAEARTAALRHYPGVNIIGVRDGFFSIDEESTIIEEIRKAAPQIIFVALGVPKQEKWLARHLHNLNIPVAIGVGGTFDVMAGKMERAPKWMQQSGLEWLYRLIKQPQRFIRMLALPRFVIRVVKSKNS